MTVPVLAAHRQVKARGGGLSGAVMQRRLIVVANRPPVTLRPSNGIWNTEQSSGGVASAMRPLLDQTGGEWIRWPGGQLDVEDYA